MRERGLFSAVMFGMFLGRFFRMMNGVEMVPMYGVGMMGSLFMVSGGVMASLGISLTPSRSSGASDALMELTS